MIREVVSTITGKGQVTLPVAVRRHLGLSVHDKVAFVIDEDGSVRVRPVRYPTVASLQGAAGSLPQPMTWDQMLEIAREDYLTAEYGRDE